jgi:type 1 fimbriae regulatory protein FimB/type 1 fimbriae regulatory protein FimE
MILIGYRHGLRAAELCDLQWHQVELNGGRLHVHRRKNGTPSVHTMQGGEIRALRRLQREQGASGGEAFVFVSERGGPHQKLSMFGRIGRRAAMPFEIHPHMLRHGCDYAIEAWLGHKNIQHTVRYTELAPNRFRNFWRT